MWTSQWSVTIFGETIFGVCRVGQSKYCLGYTPGGVSKGLLLSGHLSGFLFQKMGGAISTI
jgi:hypothetical protein